MIPEIYRKLGVRPVIHGSGTTTRYGGSLLRPEALEAMREASLALVNIDELNEAAGAAIARMLGAEAAFVTAGASSGLILQAAACIAGDDPAKITRLPDTRGMRNEIIIQRAHRFAYDQAYRVAGGVLVDIGLARRTQPYELEEAITDRTAAVAYLISPFTSPPGILSLEQVVAIAHRRGVPVIVDAASMLPPRENLTKFLRLGADLVSFSGGKGIRGPQSTGILAGRRDLVRAASLNASPNQALRGRARRRESRDPPRGRLLHAGLGGTVGPRRAGGPGPGRSTHLRATRGAPGRLLRRDRDRSDQPPARRGSDRRGAAP